MKAVIFTRRIVVLVFCTWLLGSDIVTGQPSNPVANSDAIVLAGNARFTVLTPRSIRLEWSSKKQFVDRASLVFQPYFTATADNVAYTYWSHDIGGHTRGNSPPELYTRWVQFGAFSPIFRTHAIKSEKIERRFWAYPLPYFQAMKKAVQLREQLIPYIYSAVFRTYQTGLAFCYPLYFAYPRISASYRMKNEYFFGSKMIVHPVTHPLKNESLATVQTTWLPPGQWIEWSTGTLIQGNRFWEQSYALDEIPVFVKAGAIIPMQADSIFHASIQPNPLILTIFPAGSDSMAVYEDDGLSTDYRTGAFTLLPVKSFYQDDELTVFIGPVRGNFQGMLRQRRYEIRLPFSLPPKSVVIDGQPVQYGHNGEPGTWSYQGETLETRIPIPLSDVHRQVKVVVKFSHRFPQLMSGVFGQMTRLRQIVQFVAAHGMDKSRLSNDLLVRLAQIELRLQQHPEKAVEIVGEFQKSWVKIKAMLQQAARIDPAFRSYRDFLEALQ